MRQSTIRVESRRAPAIRWACPACHDTVPFDCSERFRANSNGKVVDIWLVYRCRRCDATKNITVLERRPVDRGTVRVDARHRLDVARLWAGPVRVIRSA